MAGIGDGLVDRVRDRRRDLGGTFRAPRIEPTRDDERRRVNVTQPVVHRGHDALPRAQEAARQALGSVRPALRRQPRPDLGAESHVAGEDRLRRPVPSEPVEVPALQLSTQRRSELPTDGAFLGIGDAGRRRLELKSRSTTPGKSMARRNATRAPRE